MDTVNDKRLYFIGEVVDTLNLDDNKHSRSMLKRLDRLGKKLDYNIDTFKLAAKYAQEGRPLSFKNNNKNYRLTEPDVKFLLETHTKKDGGLLPIDDYLLVE